jgi:hypothetical protein
VSGPARRLAPPYVVIAVVLWLLTGPLMAMVVAQQSGELTASETYPAGMRGPVGFLLAAYAIVLGLATVCALGMLVRRRWAAPAMAGLFAISLLLLSRLVAAGHGTGADNPYLSMVPVWARFLIWLPPLVAGAVAFIRDPSPSPSDDEA